MKVTLILIVIDRFVTISIDLLRRLEQLETWERYSIVEFDQKTKESRWHLGRLAITCILIKDLQETMV